jgi:hypothetical protein
VDYKPESIVDPSYVGFAKMTPHVAASMATAQRKPLLSKG